MASVKDPAEGSCSGITLILNRPVGGVIRGYLFYPSLDCILSSGRFESTCGLSVVQIGKIQRTGMSLSQFRKELADSSFREADKKWFPTWLLRYAGTVQPKPSGNSKIPVTQVPNNEQRCCFHVDTYTSQLFQSFAEFQIVFPQSAVGCVDNSGSIISSRSTN